MFLGAEADIGRSERGLRRAKDITPTLARHCYAAIIRSRMRRALETPPPSVQARNFPFREPLGDDVRPPGRLLTTESRFATTNRFSEMRVRTWLRVLLPLLETPVTIVYQRPARKALTSPTRQRVRSGGDQPFTR